MTVFVLDNSVAMRWLLASQSTRDQQYAERVLKSMAESEALVPNLWHLEATNVLAGAEQKGYANAGNVEQFLSQLENLPITVDSLTAQKAFSRILALSRAYKLSAYDAAYLELALREGIPLATLDKALIKAAKKTQTLIYDPNTR